MKKIFRPWLQARDLPRESWILFFAMFINRMGNMAFPFLVLYLTSVKGFSATEAGFALSIYGFASIAAALIAGHLSDRIEPKNIIRTSLIGSALSVAIIPFLQTYAQIISVTILWSLFSESQRPANMTLLSSLSTPANRKVMFSFQRLAANLGMSMGPALGGFISERSFSWVFFANAALTLIAALVLFRVRFSSHKDRHDDANEQLSAAFANPRYLFFLLGILLMTMVYFQHESTLSIFVVDELKEPRSHFGLLFTINTLMVVFLEIQLNLMTAHWKNQTSLALGALLYAIGFGSLFFAREFWGVCLSVVIWTFGEMIESPAVSASIAEFAPKRKMGQYMGLLTMTYGAAFSIGPGLGTAIYERWGSSSVWACCFFWGLVAAVILKFGRR
jgi:MFS family permease